MNQGIDIYLADAVEAGHWHKVDQVMSGQPYLREVDLDRAMENAVSGCSSSLNSSGPI
jgi:hypothetical protein